MYFKSKILTSIKLFSLVNFLFFFFIFVWMYTHIKKKIYLTKKTTYFIIQNELE